MKCHKKPLWILIWRLKLYYWSWCPCLWMSFFGGLLGDKCDTLGDKCVTLGDRCVSHTLACHTGLRSVGGVSLSPAPKQAAVTRFSNTLMLPKGCGTW